MKRNDAMKYAFILSTILALGFVTYGWFNPPSAQAYNPQKAYSSQTIPSEGVVPPPNIDAESQTTRKTSEKDIEKWLADRSDLAAQWETADMANLAFRIGVLGVVLLAWTLFETRTASDSTSNALRITEDTLEETKRSTRLELQPYLAIGIKSVEIIPARESSGVGEYIIFGFKAHITVKNTGKTPLNDVLLNIGANASIPKKPIKPTKFTGIDLNSKTIEREETFPEAGPKYIASGECVKKEITCFIRFEKTDLSDVENTPLSQVPSFQLAMRISFTDQFVAKGDKATRYGRRVFVADFGQIATCLHKEAVLVSSFEGIAKSSDYPGAYDQGAYSPAFYRHESDAMQALNNT